MLYKSGVEISIRHEGKWKDVEVFERIDGEWVEGVDATLFQEYVVPDPPVPLWEKVTTRLTLNGVIHEGEAYEVPNLHRVIHTVELSGLTPDTVYDFAIPDGATTVYVLCKNDPSTSMVIHWQTETPVSPKGYFPNGKNSYKFKTLHNDLSVKPLTIISGGDIFQSASQLPKLQAVFDVVVNRKPDIFVIAGDIAYADNRWERYEQWHMWWDEWMAHVDPNEPIIPWVVGIGNHESRPHFHGVRFDFENKILGDTTWFAAQFAVPENGAYTVIDIGNELSLIMLDTEHASPKITGTDEQTLWLQSVLAERKNVKHVIPYVHVPSYPATRAYETEWSKRPREVWTPIFESHAGIKVVFEHHDHTYKRTVPIKHVDGVPTEHPDGIRYLGDGAMGVAIRDGWNPHTTWYLEDVKASTYVQAESGETHPLDGQPGYDTTVDEAWHMYETVYESDKRTINTLNVLGDGYGTVYHTLVQEVDHV